MQLRHEKEKNKRADRTLQRMAVQLQHQTGPALAAITPVPTLMAVPAVLNQYFVPPLMSNPATFCALVASNTPGIGAAALSPSSATAPYVFTHSTLRGATTATAPPSLNQICSCCGRLRKGHGRRGKWGKSCIHTTCKCGRLASDHRSGVTFGPYCTLESMNSI